MAKAAPSRGDWSQGSTNPRQREVGVQQYVLSRCAVCGRLEALARHRRDEHFIETGVGIWIHLGECLARWSEADEAQRTDWSVQAVRWRDAS